MNFNRVNMQFSVDGHRFTLTLSRHATGCGVLCHPEQLYFTPLCEAVVTAIGSGFERLIESLDKKTGQDWEGAVGYDYASNVYLYESPSLAPPEVYLSYMSQELTVHEQFFEQYVVEHGLAYLTATAQLGLDVPEHDRWEMELLARRNRGIRTERDRR